MRSHYKNVFHIFRAFAERGLIEDYSRVPGFLQGDFWLTERGLVTALALGADPVKIRNVIPPLPSSVTAQDRDWIMFYLDWAVQMPPGRFAPYADAFLKAGSGEQFRLIPLPEDMDSMVRALRGHPAIKESFKSAFNEFTKSLG